MGLLEAALPSSNTQEPTLKSGKGIYRGYFIGLSEPFKFVSKWGDKCRLCKGKGTNYNGDGHCRVCGGSGTLTETHVKLRYHLENAVIEEEEVNFKLLPAGTSATGTPLSPTTLFLRLRTLSGDNRATEQSLDAWYSALPQPIKIPITVVIGDNKSGNALKITAVELRQQGAPAAAAPVAAPIEEFDENFDSDLPF